MKILVVSDSHYFNDFLKRILDKYKDKIDIFIHAGDSSLPKDDELIQQFDVVVKGNHDDENFPIYDIYNNIFITHGHVYKVYKTYDQLINICKENHCHICIHGHTHVPTVQYHQDILFINPGSIMMNRGSYGYGTYAILEIDDDKISIKHYHHETDEVTPQSILDEGLELLEEFKKISNKNKA